MKTTVSTKDYTAYLFGVVFLIVYLFGADLFAHDELPAGVFQDKLTGLKVFQNYPNPVTSVTTFQIEAISPKEYIDQFKRERKEELERFKIVIYNSIGQPIQEVNFDWNGVQSGGSFTSGLAIRLDGYGNFNKYTKRYTAGIYFCVLIANGRQFAVMKMTVVK